MEAAPIRRKGAGWMLNLAEMAVAQDAHTRQPAEMQAQAAAYIAAKGLPEVKPLRVVIKPLTATRQGV
jgi:hypothetical protein